MTWLPITILAYFFLAIAVFGDKYLLTGGVSNPKVYSFYVGILSIFVLALIPFGFFLPSPAQIVLALSAGIIFIIALFVYYSVVKNFEVSRIAPAVGGLTPIFVFLITYFFSQERTFLSSKEIFAFLLLIFGSVLIVVEKGKNIFGKSFLLSSVAGFCFALYFVLAKFVYLPLGFINGLIWIRIGSFVAGDMII